MENQDVTNKGQQICQACQNAPATVIERADDPEQPYELCAACHHRLLTYSLRPREWYNLAVLHSYHKFHLHDDFYDDDGEAHQADEPVVDAEEHPAPTLADVAGSPPALLDYALTRWQVHPELAPAWQKRPELLDTMREYAAEIWLALIQGRLDRTINGAILSRLYELCGLLLGSRAAGMVRQGWEQHRDKTFGALAFALSRCLPVEEGFPKVAGEIARLPERERWGCLILLSDFQTPMALDWIEQTIEAFHDNYGLLAASSGFDWLRAKKWLAGGRPLSLVALDALKDVAAHGTRLLRAQRPRLLNPPSPAEFVATIKDYRQRDDVLRTERREKTILEHRGVLLTGQHLPREARDIMDTELIRLGSHTMIPPERRIELCRALGPASVLDDDAYRQVNAAKGLPELTLADRVRVRIGLLVARKLLPLWPAACAETDARAGWEAHVEAVAADIAGEPASTPTEPDPAAIEAQEQAYLQRRASGPIEAISVYTVPRRHIPEHIIAITERVLNGEVEDTADFLMQTNEWWEYSIEPEDGGREHFIQEAIREVLYEAVGWNHHDRQHDVPQALRKYTATPSPATRAVLAYAGRFEDDGVYLDRDKEREFWRWWLMEAIPAAWNQEMNERVDRT